MHAREGNSAGDCRMKVSPEQVRRHLEELRDALEARGFRVLLHPRAYLTAINDATGAPAGLSQVIALGPDGDDALTWFWMWSGSTRDDPPEYERIGPVSAIAEVVERTNRILAPVSAAPEAGTRV